MQATSARDSKRPTVRLKPEPLAEYRNRLGLTSNAALAAAAGVDQATLQRALSGAVQPSGPFIAGLLNVTGAKFEELFEVGQGEDGRS